MRDFNGMPTRPERIAYRGRDLPAKAYADIDAPWWNGLLAAKPDDATA